VSEPTDGGDLVRRRLEKLDELRQRGIDPFGGRYPITHRAGLLQERFRPASDDELEGAGPVTLAGRVMALRHHGKSCFSNLLDGTGQIQLYAKADHLGQDYDLFTSFDVGDFIGVTGELFRTKTGELTVHVKAFTFLAKSLRPLPEKWHGLRDVETRYRQRYADLLVNPKAREVFLLRSRIVGSLRRFLEEKGFIEVETPMMQPVPGGAAARPFITHHNALKMDLYLRIAPELYLKRLVVGGLDRVYELGRNFRNEGISTDHNPEFTMLEFYQAYADYGDLMELTEALFLGLVSDLFGASRSTYQGMMIDFTPPWPRLRFFDGITTGLGLPAAARNDPRALIEAASARGIAVNPEATLVALWKDLFDALVEPTLIRPTFVVDFPIELCPLAKRRRDDPTLAERFELFVAGKEMANGYSELNDPLEQKERFLAQLRERARGDEEAHRMDEDYLRALEYGMPPTAGEGIGVDRLIMLFADQPSIREVIFFPQLRPEGGS